MALFLSACARDEAAIRAAGRAQAEAAVTDQALALSERHAALPAWPADCLVRGKSRVKAGEPLAAALLKTDAALAAANARLDRCAAWYGEIRAAHGGGR